MTQKKWTVHGLEKALESVPAEQRASVAADVVEQLRDFDPDDELGEPVPVVAPGTRTCPSCGRGLVELGLIPNPEGESLCILECESCDGTFCESAEAPLQ